jgi:hypothetical protein
VTCAEASPSTPSAPGAETGQEFCGVMARVVADVGRPGDRHVERIAVAGVERHRRDHVQQHAAPAPLPGPRARLKITLPAAAVVWTSSESPAPELVVAVVAVERKAAELVIAHRGRSGAGGLIGQRHSLKHARHRVGVEERQLENRRAFASPGSVLRVGCSAVTRIPAPNATSRGTMSELFPDTGSAWSTALMLAASSSVCPAVPTFAVA